MWKRCNFLRSVTRARLPGKWSVSLPRVSISPHTSLHRGVDRYSCILRRDLPHRRPCIQTNTMKCSVCNLLDVPFNRRASKNTGGKTRGEEQPASIYESSMVGGHNKDDPRFSLRFSSYGWWESLEYYSTTEGRDKGNLDVWSLIFRSAREGRMANSFLTIRRVQSSGSWNSAILEGCSCLRAEKVARSFSRKLQ